MRLIKMFGLAAVAAVAAMAFIGASSASAVSTQLCNSHTGLTCSDENKVTEIHQVLKTGTVGQLLAAIDVLCLGFLVQAKVTGLKEVEGKLVHTDGELVTNGPQTVTSVEQVFTACGTGSTHNNCTVSIPKIGEVLQQPVFNLLKTGLDVGTLTAISGQTRLVCSNLGLNCLYDAEGMEFSVGGGHLTASETGVNELGGKFLCPDEGLLDALLETLGTVKVLG